jgi:hypothetical protein
MTTQERLPTGNGTTDLWESATAGNKWDDVDDPVGAPDDGTTYIFEDDGNATQLFTFTAFAITSSAISHIRIYARAQRTVAGSVGLHRRLRVNGTTSNVGTQSSATTAWADYTVDQLTNPDTALGWTEADVEGTGANPLQEFGVAATGFNAGERLEVSAVYIQVDYTEAGGGGGTVLMDLIGVGLLPFPR